MKTILLTLIAIIIVILILFWCYAQPDIFRHNYYFDNNGTTMPESSVVSMRNRCLYLGNPSSSYAHVAKRIIQESKDAVREYTHNPPNVRVVFTSCGSESINTIIRSVIDGSAPKSHIITSNAEHKTTLDCCKNLESLNTEVTYLPIVPYNSEGEYGHITVQQVMSALQPNTVLVTLLHSNNETGALTNIGEIGRALKKHNSSILFHVDAVQTFGKIPINLRDNGIDALSFSGHKFGAGYGVGGLLLMPSVNINFVLICGTQNDGLRGGTENVPAIAGVKTALDLVKYNRNSKNKLMNKMRSYIFDQLNMKLPPQYILYSLTPRNSVDNTLMISINYKDSRDFCNVKYKERLEKAHVIISIGSACNTTSKNASHVIEALGIDKKMRKGVVRISLGDHTSWRDCRALVNKMIRHIE
jgi:cysteine desulfurase